MRIATWNINGLRARLDLLLLWLRDRKPDVVGLQELKLEDDAFPRAELEAAGYHALVHGQKSWNGVAILSREPAGRRSRWGCRARRPAGARLLAARIGDLSFTTVYCPNGKHTGHDDFPAQAGVVRVARRAPRGDREARAPRPSWRRLQRRPGRDRLLRRGGAARLDLPHRRRARALRAPCSTRASSTCSAPSTRTTQAFSWWDYRGGAFHRKQGLRIDLLLATPRGASSGSAHVEIDREFRKKQNDLTPSDHAPVLADLG